MLSTFRALAPYIVMDVEMNAGLAIGAERVNVIAGDVQVFTDLMARHVLSLPVISGKSKRIGYAISHTVTDPKGMEVGHALTFGPDRDIFVQAMHKAAADAIRNVRLVRSTSHQMLRGIEDNE